jgi:hypothetical protein
MKATVIIPTLNEKENVAILIPNQSMASFPLEVMKMNTLPITTGQGLFNF